MNSQVERGTVREMVHTIAFRAGVLERILQEPVLGGLEVRTDELAYVQLLQKQIDDLRRYLNLPSAEPERKWIPVTEALPEEDEEVLVTVRFDGLEKHENVWNEHIKPSNYVEIASQIDSYWSSCSDEYKVARNRHHVIAWMPLPEPWRGDR